MNQNQLDAFSSLSMSAGHKVPSKIDGNRVSGTIWDLCMIKHHEIHNFNQFIALSFVVPAQRHFCFFIA